MRMNNDPHFPTQICFNGDGDTYTRVCQNDVWSTWAKVCLQTEVVQKFNTSITPSAGVTGLYNTVIDCATQLVTLLKTKGASSYSGLVTYSGSWSGQYIGLVYDALCIVYGTFRSGDTIYNFYAIHNGTDLKIDTDVPVSVNVPITAAGCGGEIIYNKIGHIVTVDFIDIHATIAGTMVFLAAGSLPIPAQSSGVSNSNHHCVLHRGGNMPNGDTCLAFVASDGSVSIETSANTTMMYGSITYISAS